MVSASKRWRSAGPSVLNVLNCDPCPWTLAAFHTDYRFRIMPCCSSCSLNVTASAGNREKPAEHLCISKVLSNRLAKGRVGGTPQWWGAAADSEESWAIHWTYGIEIYWNWVFPMTLARSQSNKTPQVTECPVVTPWAVLPRIEPHVVIRDAASAAVMLSRRDRSIWGPVDSWMFPKWWNCGNNNKCPLGYHLHAFSKA